MESITVTFTDCEYDVILVTADKDSYTIGISPQSMFEGRDVLWFEKMPKIDAVKLFGISRSYSDMRGLEHMHGHVNVDGEETKFYIRKEWSKGWYCMLYTDNFDYKSNIRTVEVDAQTALYVSLCKKYGWKDDDNRNATYHAWHNADNIEFVRF